MFAHAYAFEAVHDNENNTTIKWIRRKLINDSKYLFIGLDSPASRFRPVSEIHSADRFTGGVNQAQQFSWMNKVRVRPNPCTLRSFVSLSHQQDRHAGWALNVDTIANPNLDSGDADPIAMVLSGRGSGFLVNWPDGVRGCQARQISLGNFHQTLA